MITTTRTQNNLLIHSVLRRPDGFVVIAFSIMKAGIYYNVRQFSKVYNRRFPAGFVMTPAIGDPMHSQDPLFVPFPGAVFRYVWNAPRDGFGTGSLYGTTFQLSYVDFLCCDEMEGGATEPPVVPPPIPPPPPPVVPPPVVPPPPPPPGMPGIPPTLFGNPGGAVPPGVQEPNAGNTETDEPPGSAGGSVDGGQPTGPVSPPVVPPWLPPPVSTASQTPSGATIVSTPVLTPEMFPYVNLTDVSPPVRPIAIGTPSPVKPDVSLPQTMGPEQLAQSYGLAEYRPLPPYPVAPELAGLFAVPEDPST